MRTTLTLDDDIADSLKEKARLLSKPFKQVVNEALRRGMSPAIGSVRGPNTGSPQIAAGSLRESTH